MANFSNLIVVSDSPYCKNTSSPSLRELREICSYRGYLKNMTSATILKQLYIDKKQSAVILLIFIFLAVATLLSLTSGAKEGAVFYRNPQVIHRAFGAGPSDAVLASNAPIGLYIERSPAPRLEEETKGYFTAKAGPRSILKNKPVAAVKIEPEELSNSDEFGLFAKI